MASRDKLSEALPGMLPARPNLAARRATALGLEISVFRGGQFRIPSGWMLKPIGPRPFVKPSMLVADEPGDGKFR